MNRRFTSVIIGTYPWDEKQLTTEKGRPILIEILVKKNRAALSEYFIGAVYPGGNAFSRRKDPLKLCVSRHIKGRRHVEYE